MYMIEEYHKVEQIASSSLSYMISPEMLNRQRWLSERELEDLRMQQLAKLNAEMQYFPINESVEEEDINGEQSTIIINESIVEDKVPNIVLT